MGLPGVRRNLVLQYKWIGDAIGVVGAFVAGYGAILVKSQFWEADRRYAGTDAGHLDASGLTYVWIGVVVAVLAALWRLVVGIAESRKVDRVESPGEIRACCAMMISALRVVAEPAPEDGLRITVYRVHRQRREPLLVQLVPYVGGDGGKPGRLISARAGIVGRVVNLGEPHFASRVSGDAEQFLAEMQREWSFTEEEAKKLNPRVWSWAGLPVRDDKRVIGVVYLDSTAKGFFDDRRKVALAQLVEGLTAYTKERYP